MLKLVSSIVGEYYFCRLTESSLSRQELAVKCTATTCPNRPRAPASEGEVPHCKSRLHRATSSRSVPASNHCGESVSAIGWFVHHFWHERYHESLNNLTPADVYYGQGTKILRMRREKLAEDNERAPTDGPSAQGGSKET